MARTSGSGAKAPRETHRTASMADVAREAGVSQQTVSRVVNGQPNVSDLTRKRVNDAIVRLGFRPNYAGRTLRDGHYRTVGLCTFDMTQVGNLSTFEGVVMAAREKGYAVTMIEMGPEMAPYSVSYATRRLGELPVDGAIINLNTLPEDFEEYTPLAGLNTVLVTMYAHPRCTTVDSDQCGCSLIAMNYLRTLGHEQIRYIGARRTTRTPRFVRRAGRMSWRRPASRRGSPCAVTGRPTAATSRGRSLPTTTR